MTSTDTADKVDCDVVDFGALVLAMSKSTTVQTGLVLVVSQCSVQRGQLSQLHTLQFVLSLGH